MEHKNRKDKILKRKNRRNKKLSQRRSQNQNKNNNITMSNKSRTSLIRRKLGRMKVHLKIRK